MPKALENTNDIIGRKFGKLTVKSYIGREICGKKTPTHIYDCDCDCGKTHVHAGRQSLLKGDKKSCGCAHQDAGNSVLEDLTGQKFGRWTVIGRVPNRVSKSGKTRSVMWHCRCDCGNEKDVGARALKKGMSLSCGCLQKERVSEALTDDLTGKTFSHLTVMYRNGSWKPKNYGTAGHKGGVRAIWHCQCDCGNECDVVGELLRNGDVTSCGCSHTPKYESFVSKYLESIGYMLNVDYFREKTFEELKGVGNGSLRFDFFVKLKSGESVLIECQGEQHIRSTKWFGGDEYLKRLQRHDELKREFANRNNIRLIEISHKKVTYESISEFLANENIK